MSKIVPLDHFYIGFFHGANRVRYPYGYDGGMYTDPESHIYGPHGQAAWLLRHRQTYRMQYDNGAALNAGVASGDTSRASADAVTTPLFRRGRDGRAGGVRHDVHAELPSPTCSTTIPSAPSSGWPIWWPAC